MIHRVVLSIFLSMIIGATLSHAQSQDNTQDIPIADVHIHYSHDAWSIYPPKQAIGILRSANLKHAFVSSSSDEGTQMLYDEAPDLIVPVLRPYTRRGQLGTWMDDPEIIDHVKERLKKYTYEGIGEFHVYGDNTNSTGVREIVQLAQEYDLFLHAHSDAQAVRNIFEQDPQARVLWAHSGFDQPNDVAQLLSEYDNLWSDLAFRSDQASDGVVQKDWLDVFSKFPDRFMLGTDTYTPERWPYVIAHAQWSREWLSTLPNELAQKIAWQNADALLAKKNR